MLSPTLKRACQSVCVGLLPLFLLGCASAYIPPGEYEPGASISFEVEGDAILGYVASFYYFETTDDRTCMSPLKTMAKVNKGNPLAGKSTNTDNIRIPADRTIIIRSIYSPASAFSQRSCSGDSFLQAEPGKKYLLRIKWLANQCAFDFFDVTSVEPVKIRVKTEPAACQ